MNMDFDYVLGLVGHFGPYQLIMYILLCLPASLPSAWSCFNQVFVAAIPEHHCHIPGVPPSSPVLRNYLPTVFDKNGIPSLSSCERFVSPVLEEGRRANATTMPCNMGWDFNQTTYKRTIATDFNLVCHDEWLVETSTTLFYVGSFMGNLLFGWVADKWGRRVSFFIILAVQVTFGTACAFAWNVQSFIVLRFIVGFTFPALYQIPFIVAMELMGPSKRVFSGLMICVFFGSSMGLLGIIAWALRDWVWITIVSNAPFVILFSYWFFLPESPRWLITVHRVEEATKVLSQIGKCNGKTSDVDTLRQYCQRLCEREEIQSHSPQGQADAPNLLDLFRTPNLRRKTIIITYVWFVNAVVYNGLTLYASNLPVNDYLSFMINGAVELPAYFILWPLLHLVGRRWPLCIAMVFGGVACLATIIVPEGYSVWFMSSLAFAGKFGIAASFAVIYIFAGELYPTVLRAIGMGMSSMVAGIGLVLAPSLVGLSSITPLLPLIVMGVMMLSAGLAAILLPETVGAPLPQTILDAELFGADFSFWHCRQNSRGVGSEEGDDEVVVPMIIRNHGSMTRRKSDMS